jgi:serine/threonine protein kinase
MDVYSFGVLLYEVLSSSPFLSPSFSSCELREQVCAGVVLPIPSTLSPYMRELIHSCLPIDRWDRPETLSVIDGFLKTGRDPLFPEESFDLSPPWDFAFEMEEKRGERNLGLSFVTRFVLIGDTGDCCVQNCLGYLLTYGAIS